MSDEARLLLVDDERDIREPLAAYLARNGYKVSKAANAEAARALLAGKEFDLVLPTSDARRRRPGADRLHRATTNLP